MRRIANFCRNRGLCHAGRAQRDCSRGKSSLHKSQRSGLAAEARNTNFFQDSLGAPAIRFPRFATAVEAYADRPTTAHHS